MLTTRRLAATLISMGLLVHGLCFPSAAYTAASPKVNFKFVDPNQGSAAGETQNDSTSSSIDAKTDVSKESDTSDTNTSDTKEPQSSATTAIESDTAAAGKDGADVPSTTSGGVQSGKMGVADETEQGNTSDQGEARAGAAASTEKGDETTAKTDDTQGGDGSKVLQGYIRVVPSGTKVPIIMDTAVDSDTSQEGDEFSARTGEDLDIDGTTVVPAGSTIRGRVAQLNLPRRMDRSGSVALKFDTITTPDNRQIPLVANLVARGGVVHARRGIKDIAIDTSAVALPTLAGLGIGVIAGKSSSSSSIGAGGGALIGAGLGVAVGVAILLAKKGKKVDVRPGDELKIELAEDLRMPM